MLSLPITIRKSRAAWWPTSPCRAPTACSCSQLLTASDRSLPIVFITGNGNVRMSVQAMRAGAVTFLPKPVRLSELAAAVREALERDHSRAPETRDARRHPVAARRP